MVKKVICLLISFLILCLFIIITFWGVEEYQFLKFINICKWLSAVCCFTLIIGALLLFTVDKKKISGAGAFATRKQSSLVK